MTGVEVAFACADAEVELSAELLRDEVASSFDYLRAVLAARFANAYRILAAVDEVVS
jgi:hypothetical protein